MAADVHAQDAARCLLGLVGGADDDHPAGLAPPAGGHLRLEGQKERSRQKRFDLSVRRASALRIDHQGQSRLQPLQRRANAAGQEQKTESQRRDQIKPARNPQEGRQQAHRHQHQGIQNDLLSRHAAVRFYYR